MVKVPTLFHRGLYLRKWFNLRTLLGILAETFFPSKRVALGLALVLSGLLIQLSLVLDLVDGSMSLLFLAFAVMFAGGIACLIGCTCCLGVNRA